MSVREISLGVGSMPALIGKLGEGRSRQREQQKPSPCCGFRNQPRNSEGGEGSSGGVNGEVGGA